MIDRQVSEKRPEEANSQPRTQWGRTWAIRMSCFLVLTMPAIPVSIASAQSRQPAASPYSLQGKVVRVADGDTFTLLVEGRQNRIRMASIDAPETGNGKQRPGQPHAVAARNALSSLISGKTLTLSCHEEDRHGRHICDVLLEDGRTANQVLVRQGMAWANREKRGIFLRDPRIADLEQQARKDKVGLWRDANPVQPWVWRYRCWQQKQCKV